MTAPLVLSASSVNTYLRCGQQWYYAYVENRKAPPRVRQVIGIAAHDAIEVNMKQKVSSKVDVPTDVVLDAFSDSYDLQVTDIEEPEEDPGDAKDSGIAIVRLYHQTVAPPIVPVMVEEHVPFVINGHEFSGYLDIVEEVVDPLFGESQLIVRDTKTTARAPQRNQYILAMTGYAIGVRQKTGRTEADSVLDYLVRTKKPYYQKVGWGGPVSDAAISQFATTVDEVAAGVNAGTFVANGINSNACSWCGYANICPAYRAFYGSNK